VPFAIETERVAHAPTRIPAAHVPARILGLAEHHFYLAAGLATAPLLAATPLLRTMGWFLASLTHETGHAATAWFFGMPAVPAIRLDGHAAAVHGGQVTVLVGVLALLLGTTVFRL